MTTSPQPDARAPAGPMFVAETERVRDDALRKLAEKLCDVGYWCEEWGAGGSSNRPSLN